MIYLYQIINDKNKPLYASMYEPEDGLSHGVRNNFFTTVSWSDVLQNEYKEEHLSPFNTRQYDNIMDIVFEYEKTGLSPRIDIEDL